MPGDVELTGVRYPQLVHYQGLSFLMVGANYGNGFKTSGIIKRLTLLGNSGGVVRAMVETDQKKLVPVLILPSGAAAEVAE